jgi:hypothetical protein
MAEVVHPDNDYTRMIEMVSSQNRSGMRGVASATPLPTAQSADVGRVADPPPPMSSEERANLDRLAIEAGVKDDRLASADPGQYPSLEEAVAAGAPVKPNYTPRALMSRERMTAREAMAISTPRLPDFRRVEGIDLLRDRILIDGMEFPIPVDDAVHFKQYVVSIAKAAIMKMLNEATSLFAAPVTPAEVTSGGSTAESTSTEVQRQSQGDSPEPTV